ncbi:hypothetical protein [Clostridium polynesiense]|uniref:hypothetical protein n=1 Tax=Clostridium polynesiense TaxID=1325933 RepID=UPI00058CA369|nr:hypothetical protein [Clostridium polynesiense]
MNFKKVLSGLLVSCLIISSQTTLASARDFSKTNSKSQEISIIQELDNIDGKLIKQEGQEYTYEMINITKSTKEIITVNLEKDLVKSSLDNKGSKVSDYVKDYNKSYDLTNQIHNKNAFNLNSLSYSSYDWVTGAQRVPYSNSILVDVTTTAIATIATVLTRSDTTKAKEIVKELSIKLGSSIIGKIFTVYYYINQWYQPSNYMYTEERRDYYTDSSYSKFLYTSTYYFYGIPPY